MAKYIYNPTEDSIYYQGKEFLPNTYKQLAENLIQEYATDDTLLADLANQVVKMSSNGTSILSGNGSNHINFLKGDVPLDIKIIEQPVFAAKTVNGKKLYTRATGITFDLEVGANVIDFVIPFNEVKFNGIEIDDAKKGENVSLKILDTATGTITTVPYYTLNQFGYNLNLPNGFYVRESKYDADLFIGLVIRVEYNAVEARTIGINYMIHELKI